MNSDASDRAYSEEEIEFLLSTKFKIVYSQKLDRNVYTLIEWVEKSVFKKYKKLFGYTDIGWTVKHPKQLSRALLSENIWKVEPENVSKFIKEKQEIDDKGQIAD